MKKTPTTLILMNGLGLRDAEEGNAVKTANTPMLDRLLGEFAHTTLAASGPAVGLPEGQSGDSESGWDGVIAGRVVPQALTRINAAIADGTFYENPAYNAAMDACLERGSALHLMGLLSDGGVHASTEHLYALLKMASIKGLRRIYLHVFLDGRDSRPKAGKGLVEQVMKKCAVLGVGKIATVMGRRWAMNRDGRWDRIETAYDALVYGEGAQDEDPVRAISASYRDGLTDPFVEPIVCDHGGMIGDHDSVIFFNFRADRARELTRVFVDPAFDGFQREFFPVTFACNADFGGAMPNVLTAFPRPAVKNTLGEYLSEMGMTQLRVSETDGYDTGTPCREGEERLLIPSPKLPAYDRRPEMSAAELTDRCVERILSGAYDVVILDLANCGMIGHTGTFDAVVKAVETVDECVGRVVDATLQMSGLALVTSGYGNAEEMLDGEGKPRTSNTTNPVPFILCGAGAELREGSLADIAPTLLDVLGLAQPEEMTGKTLIVN